MRALLDTHVVLWATSEPDRLNEPVRTILENNSNELYFSVAGVWELAIKVAHRKLRLPGDLRRWVTKRMQRTRITLLSIESHHVFALAELPYHHRDPFDRMIIAQAIAEKLTLVTADRILTRYDVPVVIA